LISRFFTLDRLLDCGHPADEAASVEAKTVQGADGTRAGSRSSIRAERIAFVSFAAASNRNRLPNNLRRFRKQAVDSRDVHFVGNVAQKNRVRPARHRIAAAITEKAAPLGSPPLQPELGTSPPQIFSIRVGK
jgi:hypothetical protein